MGSFDNFILYFSKKQFNKLKAEAAFPSQKRNDCLSGGYCL